MLRRARRRCACRLPSAAGRLLAREVEVEINAHNWLGLDLKALEKVEEKLPEVRVRPLVTIEEMMDTLLSRVQRAMTLSFKEFSAGSAEKVEVIVSFLALLELVKQGAVEAAQHDAFTDIRITNTSAGVPRY